MLDQMGILRDYENHRVSIWDRSGKNTDWYFAEGTGCIKIEGGSRIELKT